MSVKEAARAVSERDDRLLAEKMEALEAANREVSCLFHLLMLDLRVRNIAGWSHATTSPELFLQFTTQVVNCMSYGKFRLKCVVGNR
jgi:hypothetical protein